MKKVLLTAVLVGAFAAAPAMAQMGGHGGMGMGHQQSQMTGNQQDSGMMSSQQSQHMMGGQQMMHQNMMRDMSGMMHQMNQMMRDISRMMDQHKDMSHSGMQKMSGLMNDMSTTMKDMSQQMATGQMDPALTKQMRDRIKAMNQIIESTQKEGL